MDLSIIKCRVPKPGEYFRVNPDPAYRQDAYVTFNDDDGEFYMITANVIEALKAEGKLSDKIKDATLFLACNDKHENFIWPVQKPVPEDHPAFVAMAHWIRLMPIGEGYTLQ